MKTKDLLPITLTVLLAACAGNNKQHTETSDGDQQPTETGNSRDDYTFSTSFNDLGGGFTDEITVQGYHKGKKTDFHHVADLMGQFALEYTPNIDWLRDVDLDFDGIADLMVYRGISPLDYFDAFLFRPATGMFERVADFEDIPNPVADSERKVIVSEYYDPNRNDTLFTDIYEWHNGQLKLTSRSSHSESDLRPDRKARTFRTTFEFDDDDQWITTMTVQEYADGQPTDFSFTVDISGSFDHKQAELFPWVTDEDINFDGIPDLVVYIGIGGYTQASSLYKAYTWNTDTRQWDYCEEYDQLIEPEVDAETKTIHSSYRDGNTFYQEEWKWRDGRLTMVSRDQMDI